MNLRKQSFRCFSLCAENRRVESPSALNSHPNLLLEGVLDARRKFYLGSYFLDYIRPN